MTSPADIRTLIRSLLEQRFLLAGISPAEEIDDSFDLFESGVLDSLGFVELLVALEDRLGITLDTSSLSTSEISNFSAFSAFVHAATQRPDP
jgi:acyl carrier protein